MVTGNMLILIFLLAIALLFLLIIKFKWEPFLALISVSILVGIFSGIPLTEIPIIITGGFGDSLAGVGLLIGLGIMIGQLLGASGAIERIGHSLLKLFGAKRAHTAVAYTGALVSIPVFFDAAFIILINLIRNLSKQAKISMVTLTTALSVGLIVTHGVVPPTPGPLIVADNTNADLGFFILYGLLVSIPAVLVAGVFYGKWIGRDKPIYSNDNIKIEKHTKETSYQEGRKEISTGLSFGLLLLPIVLIVCGAILELSNFDNTFVNIILFIGEKNTALFISLLVTAYMLRPYLTEKPSELYKEAIASGGLIILISGAGGGFGAILNNSGMGEYLVEVMTGWSMPILLLAFLFSQILRATLGNTTLALITASTVLGPMATDLGASPLLLGLAICAGGIGLSLPNDSGFWVVSRFANLSVQDTLKTWTVGGTIAGVTVLLMVYVLSLFQGILPGI
ncbi:GntP family permease [Pseudogracilibacillus sp. SO30301A]|uniref:GntP family permease n=1 Tax=Pseudogracilibacillus sp. SO30301A TaxID=3098291 RepID=UPI00300E68AF